VKRPLVRAAGALLLVGLVLLAWGWHAWTTGSDATGAAVIVEIPPGMTLGSAADTLVTRGLLAHRSTFLLGARLTGRDRELRAGRYELERGSSPRRLLEVLTGGRSLPVRLTVPEGLDAAEIAAIVAETLAVPAESFLTAADSVVAAAAQAGRPLDLGLPGDYVRQLEAETVRRPRHFRLCEGYLAPDTYAFAPGTGARAAAAHLVTVQFERLAGALAAARDTDLTPHELLTLASIVEAEARRDDERARIAAVYVNRLDRGRRLEADPTVAYVLGKKGQRIFYRDLEVDSPWNTYRTRGLPLGPIGSPGVASLQAAARPDSACDALYFVSDGADGHVFSRTAREHEEAVRRFRSTRAEARRRDRD